ncbi:MAG: ABC transporter substrate-binding protein [Actinomycetota bacterium]|nr:ABC transporter substrate-binding protein [Actinomycetota bacterium]
MLIRLGHSLDPDDAFMFWGLASGRVDPGEFEFEHVLRDIRTLNEWALDGRLEVSAISLDTYPFVQDRYVILPHGAGMGSGYGPVVVALEQLSREELKGLEIAVPGRMTTASLVLRLYLGGDCRVREIPSGRVLDEVKSGRVAAALLIHDAQLIHAEHVFERVVDLGEWWLLETGLPLPLGITVARRDLGDDVLRELSNVLRASIAAGLSSRSRALAYATRFGRELDRSFADRFVGMYVNGATEDYGDEGRKAVEELLRRAEAVGAFEQPVRVEFAC